jgi:phosphonate transport system ATP-binding protein
MFVRRIVGLRLGEIVFDGPPDTMTAETLTEIYGEEDWSATIRKVDEDAAEEDATAAELSDHHAPVADRDRLAGLT